MEKNRIAEFFTFYTEMASLYKYILALKILLLKCIVKYACGCDQIGFIKCFFFLTLAQITLKCSAKFSFGLNCEISKGINRLVKVKNG